MSKEAAAWLIIKIIVDLICAIGLVYLSVNLVKLAGLLKKINIYTQKQASRAETAGNCFGCKWKKQGRYCVHCSHPDANPEGRGNYIYPYSNDTCDCGGFEPKKKPTPNNK